MSSSWLEISRKALLHNIKVIRGLLKPGTKFMAVVKGNAYGHGLEEVAQVIKDRVNWFGVDNIDDAIEIRKLGIKKPILIIGFTPAGRVEDAINNNLSLTVFNSKSLEEIISKKTLKQVKIHLKIETGFNRLGLDIPELVNIVRRIKRSKKNIRLEGIYTHFSSASDEKGSSFTLSQLNQFNQALKILEKEDLKVPLTHYAASAATLLYGQGNSNMVRIGIGLYGQWPSRYVEKRNPGLKFKPVLSWKSKIVAIKNVKKGEVVSYGRTWRAPADSRLASIPVGYFDGYDRGLSNKGAVLIKGKKAHVVGRVTMNMLMVDVTDIKNCGEQDTVVLIGKQAKNVIMADSLARRIGTINYEMVSRLNPLLPRVVV